MSAVIRGAKGGSAPHVPVESADNLRSIAFFRILDLVSEGEIAGLVNGQQSIYLDETPLANSDGTSNFPKAHIEQRTGTQDQDAIPGFDSVENEISVGVELKSTSAWLHSVSDTTLSAIRVTMGVPALSKANTSNGDITGYTVSYKIEVSTDGGAFAPAYNGAFTGKTTTKFQRSHRIDLPTATTGWQVRVTRLTANANSSAIADTTTIDSYTEIVDAKLRYPNSAVIGVMGDASQFQNIPQRAYDLWGRIIQVPSNYDVTTRAYAGVWDGTFKPSWTDNPAWIFYDLVTHPRYGLGHLISAAQVDKWELYRIGQYCDGMVSDGNGGTEPRLTCNIYLQTQADAYKLLNDLSTAFRGISYWANGAIVASADMPADPVYTYTDANVIEGKFSYSASGRKTRYTTALVSWNDPRNFFRTKVEYVEDRDGIARYGIQQTEVTAVGCTSQGQAQRLGRWILLTSRYETDTVTFSVGLDGTLAAPGQIIRVADSARAGRRQGGRVKSADASMVILDNGARVAVGASITVNMPDGTSQTRMVRTIEHPISFDSTTVTFDSMVYTFDQDSGTGDNLVLIYVTVPFTEAPRPESVWVMENPDQYAQTFRVLSVTENKSDTDLSFSITALQHNASKFDAIDNGTILQVPPISALTVKNQPAPATVIASYAVVTSQGTAKNMLQASWEAAPLAVKYIVEWRQDNGEWVSRGTVYGQSADFGAVHEGNFDVRVRAVNASGNASLFAYSSTLTISDAGFRISQGNLSTLNTLGIRSAWTGFSISYTATSASATISCTSGTLQDGVNNPVYAASSAVVSGTAGTANTYYLYYDDAPGLGGTLALGTTTNYSDLSANQSRVNVGRVDVTFPASGSSTGGGSAGGGSGGGCVTVDMWLLDGLRAGEAQIGTVIDGAAYHPDAIVPRVVTADTVMLQPCLRLVSASGCTVDASTSTPMTLRDGSLRMLPKMLGELVLVDDRGALRWEPVVQLIDIGPQWVVLLRVQDQSFFAGYEADRRVATHNLIAAK